MTEHTLEELSHVEMCHLLGPAVPQDNLKYTLPNDFVRPKNLQHFAKFEFPVGYFRLRRAVLSDDLDFWDKKVMDRTLQYKNVTSHGWDRHRDAIGSPSLPKHMKFTDIVGAKRKTEYIMPKTSLVRANMAYETATITEYNDHCFAIDMHTSNPDVPFGKRFIAHTKIVVYNTGENTCYMESSVETEFIDGPPMGVAWQIKGAMKAGSIEVFQKIGASINNCADSQ